MSEISTGTTPLMMVADALSVAMGNGDSTGSSGLSILASGAANRPKLPSSPLVAKIDELGEGGREGGSVPSHVHSVKAMLRACRLVMLHFSSLQNFH